MTFRINDLKFIDSFQFMAASVETLTNNLKDKDPELNNFPNMKSHFKDKTALLCQKGVYPYEWVDGMVKFDYIGLPPKEAFYSSLYLSNISG